MAAVIYYSRKKINIKMGLSTGNILAANACMLPLLYLEQYDEVQVFLTRYMYNINLCSRMAKKCHLIDHIHIY